MDAHYLNFLPSEEWRRTGNAQNRPAGGFVISKAEVKPKSARNTAQREQGHKPCWFSASGPWGALPGSTREEITYPHTLVLKLQPLDTFL